MTRLLVVAALTGAALACGTTDPEFDVSGQWDLVETFTNGTIDCDATGQLLLSQSSNGPQVTGSRFSSGSTCTGNPPANFDPSPPAGLSGAEVRGAAVTWSIDFCDFVGTLANESQMGGTINCPNGLSGVQEVFTGTWQATR